MKRFVESKAVREALSVNICVHCTTCGGGKVGISAMRSDNTRLAARTWEYEPHARANRVLIAHCGEGRAAHV